MKDLEHKRQGLPWTMGFTGVNTFYDFVALFLHCISHFIDVLYWNTRHHTNILLPKFFASRFRIFYCPSFLARARSFMCILYKSGDKSFLARQQVAALNSFSRGSRASVIFLQARILNFCWKSSCAKKIKQKWKKDKLSCWRTELLWGHIKSFYLQRAGC